MALPDPYANEPAVEIGENLFLQYQQALENMKAWETRASDLRAKIEAEIGSAHAGLVNGKKVFTYRPTARVAEARLRSAYPDLVQHFIKPQLVDTFDVKAFEERHPDIVDQYRSRQFRLVAE